jgi:hypothetical protein
MRYRKVVVLLASALVVSAAELSMGSGTVRGNQAATLNVNLKSDGDALTGIQFDIEFDATVFDVSLENGPAAEEADKSLQVASLGAGKRRVMIVGLNQNNLSEGVVAILRVSLKGKLEGRRRYAIGLTSPGGTNSRAQSLVVSGRSGVIELSTKGNEQ